MNKFFLILHLLLTFVLNSAEVKAESNKKDIHLTCQNSAKECLNEIPYYLNSTPANSRLWFNYKLYELEAMFQLVHIKELKKELEPWVDFDEAPLKFTISVYIFYAKIIKSEGQVELAEEYFNKAIDTLYSVHQSSADPMLVVQITNALNSLGEGQKGYDLLIDLSSRYQKSQDAKLQQEIYANLGHFALKLMKFEEHISYRKSALFWAEKQDNKQQRAVATYNLARAYQVVSRFQESYRYFLRAQKLASTAGDFNLYAMSFYQMSKLALAQGDLEKSREYFNQIDINSISQSILPSVEKLKIDISN